MALYLGFDCSTQGLTAVVIEVTERERRVLWRDSLEFDRALPHYGTRHGVLPSADPRVVHAPPGMWAEALDRMLARVARRIDRPRLRAVSGSAQQHGSVYCGPDAAGWLSRPAAGADLSRVFARPTAPTWMDASTTCECEEIESACGGGAALAALTGSRAYPRFTAAQIRRVARAEPEAWAATVHVHLVSSFMASLTIGRHAPVDHADASGMNLMDLRTRQWAAEAVAATADGLGSRLPALTASARVVGRLAPHWERRFGFPAARVAAWTGDNPSSLIGTGLIREGLLAISLGTSDTVFGLMRAPRVSEDGTGHVFVAPTGDYMGITVFRNGSLARERIRDEHGLDWAGFSAALRATAAGNGGAMMLPWFEPEITPRVATAGVRRFDLPPTDAAANVRAVVESQMLALARHAAWMAVDVRTIYATGGAAANREILQVMADVFGAEVYQFESPDSAALGAALRACHADRLASADPMEWPDVIRGFAEPVASSRVGPIPAHVEIYRAMRALHAAREAGARDPSSLL
jgi:xylulokinase